MSTSLKRQLAALAAPSSSLLAPERRRSSIIFSAQEAAKYDRETFYQIGQDGLAELVSINPGLFEPFLESILFSESSKKYERVMEDNETNDQLNEIISEFLFALHPYVMMKASLKCLEWLVYRFHIERFNVSEILQCVLPYYDTKSFVMIIQVLEIERYQMNQEWEWLVPCKNSGAPLRKAVLFDNWNSKFLLWMFSSFQRIMHVHRMQPENLRIFLGFMASTIVGLLNKLKHDLVAKPNKVNSRKFILLNILNQIFELLKTIRSNEEYQNLKNNEEIYSMAYVVMSMLAVCCREIPGMTDVVGSGLKQIFKLIIVNRGTVQITETFLLMNLMIDFLNRKWEFKNPTTFSNALKDISKVSQNWDLSNLATKLILYNMEQEKLLSPQKVFTWVEEIELGLEERSELLRQVYQGYEKDKSKKRQAKMFLVRFEKQYPLEFEIASEKYPCLATDLTKYKKKKDFVVLSDHSSPLVRSKGVKQLIRSAVYGTATTTDTKTKSKMTTPKPMVLDKNRTAVALTSRFADDDGDVLLAIWKTKLDKLLKIFSPHSLVAGIVMTLNRNVSIKSNKFALQKLCGVARLTDSSTTLHKEIMIILVPFLFPRNGKQLKLAQTILKTPFAEHHPFLQQYAPIISQENLTFQELCKESYRLISIVDDKYKPNFISKLETATETTFACILLPSEDLLTKLLHIASKMPCTRCTSFPTTNENFYKCVKLAETRHQLSFELVLTALYKVPCNDFDKIYQVIKFVWKNCEQIENREAGMKFLQKYLKLCFGSESEHYKFWIQALIQSAEIETENNEFLLIRSIQFTTSFISNLKHMEGLQKQDKGPDKPQPTRRGRKSISTNKKSTEYISCSAWNLVEVLLTTCMLHKSPRVRCFALESLKMVKNKINEQDVIRNFVEDLLQYENEIKIDPEQLVNAMAHVLSDSESLIKSEIIASLKRDDLADIKKIGLINLCASISGQVFEEIYSANALLDFHSSSQYMLKLLSCYDGSFNERLLNDVLTSKDAARVVLKQIDKTAHDSYGATAKKKIFNILVEKSLTCKYPEIKVAVLRCVRKWTLDASVVATELTKCLELEKKYAVPAVSKASNISKPAIEPQNDWVVRSEVVLEFIQGRQQLKNKTKLIQPLFKILKKCITLEEQMPVEYLKQLVLTSLTLCCQEEDTLNAEQSKDFVSFDVQTVIDCLRCSRNPQTHHHALILLNYAASRYHEQVLHGIMSLFTFMGNSILRQDDAYSTQLIQQTVMNIIPALAKTNQGDAHLLNVSAGIYRVFTSAVQDIPVHRRLPVFTSLVQTLNPGKTMWQLCIILVDNALQRDRKRSNLNADLELAVDLVWKFGPLSVSQTVEQIYNFLTSLPVFIKTPELEQFNQMKLRQTSMERSVLDFGRKESFRDVLITINFTLELVAQICSKFSDTENEDVEYDTLLGKCLFFSKKSSGLNEEKLYRLIVHKNLDVIDKINAALDPLKFIEAVALILVRNDATVKRKVLEMLNQRILQKVEWFGELHHLLELVPLLIEIASIEAESDEATTLVQTAFFSLKLLAKHLAIQHSDEFVKVFDLASKNTNHSNKLLRASAILCLSELFCLKSLILPNLNTVTTAILKAFKASAKLQISGNDSIQQQEATQDGMVDDPSKATDDENSSMTAHLLCISTMTCLNRMIEHLGSFVGMKFLRKVLIAVLSISNTFGEGEKACHRKKVFDLKLKALLKVISSKIPVRNILIPIREAFAKLLDEPAAAIILMKMLKDALLQTSKPDFILFADSLTDAFIGGFMSIRESSVCSDVEKVEDSVIDCLISGMVLKMTESHFRPLYHRIFDWAKENESRLVTFYRFSAASAERLKSLFVTFAGYVISEAVHVMHKNVDLAKAIVSFFYFIFLNDKEGFVTTDRFNSLVQPLLDLVESEYVLSGKITMSQLNDCIVQLAVATNDLNRWQHLIELISVKAGHSNKVVRLNILTTLEAAATELAKDFLPLLPPAVPFLAELMNDDDPEVESETQKLLLKMEEIVGEPLQPYFTM